MTRLGQAAIDVVVVAAIVAANSLLVPSSSASACSCGEQFPTVVDAIGQVDIAFVGRLESTEQIDPAEFNGSPEYFDTRYELIVEHAVKGVNEGDRVVMFGDVSGGSSCGTSELEGNSERYAILSSDNSGMFVADSTPPCLVLPSVDDLLAVDLTLPATNAGPVSLVVVGRLGEAELISYGADGRPVGYGDLPWSAGQPDVCPGSERLIQFEQDEADRRTTLAVRELATLKVLERIDIPDSVREDVPSEYLDDALVGGAVLDCRSEDGRDVAALVPWERSGNELTTVLGFDSDGGVSISVHGRVSQARLDQSTGGGIGVRDGALVRFAEDGEIGERVVAQLTDEPADELFGAVFVHEDGSGGWWIGLGPEGEYGIAERIEVLVNVDADGGVERWPVQGEAEYVSSVMLDGDRLVGDGFSIPLPARGSSDGGAVAGVERTDDGRTALDLGDGRSVRWIGGDGDSRYALVDGDEATTLEYLLELRFAAAVVGGPIVDVDLIDREADVVSVESQWITADGAAATDRPRPTPTMPVTTESVTSVSNTTEPASAADGGDGTSDADSIASSVPPAIDQTSDAVSSGGGPSAVLVVTVIGGLTAVGVFVWRRRRGT